jgi:predicted metal-binding membrane protein
MRTVAGRKSFLWILGVLILLAWISLWVWEQSPYGRYLHHGQWVNPSHTRLAKHFTGFSFVYYSAGWTLMTVAMMLPTTLPLVEIFQRLTLQRKNQLQLLILLIVGYISIWAGFGLVAHIGDWGLYKLIGRIPWIQSNAWVLGVGILVLAGGFQFSSLKYRCLDKCRAPLSFVMQYWQGKRDRLHSFMLGIHHGIFCVGCCWALMLLMFVVGTGSIGWMLVLGAVMAIEKNMPWGRKMSAPFGVVLIGCGMLIFIKHSWAWTY